MANTIFCHKITGLKSDNAQSNKSTPPIPQLYSAITAGCMIFTLPFPFIHLFALPTGSTPYALLSITIRLRNIGFNP